MSGASNLAHDPPASDVYGLDDYGLQNNSPMLKALRPNLAPSPSPPPAIPLPKVPPSQGDAILIHYLDGGKRPEIAAAAGLEPLVKLDDGEYDSDQSSSSDEFSDDEPDKHIVSPVMSSSPQPADPAPTTAAGPIDSLKSLAAGAFAVLQAGVSTPDETQERPNGTPEDQEMVTEEEDRSPTITVQHVQPQQPPTPQQQDYPQTQPQPPPPPPQSQAQTPQQLPQRTPSLRNPNKPVLAAPISPYSHPDLYSPRQPNSGQGLRFPNDLKSPTALPSSCLPGHGDGPLPPLQILSPRSESSGQTLLPPIRSQLGEQLEHPSNFDKELSMRIPHTPSFPHSPPGPGLPRMTPLHGGHHNVSPPISPQNFGQNSMPSPAQSIGSMLSPLYGTYSSNGSTNSHYRAGAEYSSSNNTETPSSDTISTPTTSVSATERMSIDNMTNPQTGSYVCKFAGCTAAPFQTQYLLNSHTNVHSSARPHYCSVKGCPRSEGGKGFKRKNEMIRHGLVHDSPGYVCPFCPDREHKYPRPDNLQRHVRVHHVDKDKDDPLLRDVLSQRPDGPNRGRRRRGAP